MRRAAVIMALAVLAFAFPCCRRAAPDPAADAPAKQVEGTNTAVKLVSAAFADNGTIPPRCTCDGPNVSPPLAISGVPGGAKALALVMDDPDAPSGTFDHWIVWKMPPETTAIEEGRQPRGVAGKNGFGRLTYGGPCPPSGVHTYRFKLYALDAQLDLKEGNKKVALEDAMVGHVLAEALLRGKYSRRR